MKPRTVGVSSTNSSLHGHQSSHAVEDRGMRDRSRHRVRVPDLGVRIEILETAETTGGAAVEFEVSGRPRGLIAHPHIHGLQTERHEVIEGSCGCHRRAGHRLEPGRGDDSCRSGVRHRQRAGAQEPAPRARAVEPAGDSERSSPSWPRSASPATTTGSACPGRRRARARARLRGGQPRRVRPAAPAARPLARADAARRLVAQLAIADADGEQRGRAVADPHGQLGAAEP